MTAPQKAALLDGRMTIPLAAVYETGNRPKLTYRTVKRMSDIEG